MKAHSETTQNIQPWCRVSLYKKSGQFLITEKGTHYHFCILSPFNSSSGFVSTKSAKTVFFVAHFSSLVNQSGITHVISEWGNCCLDTTKCWNCDSFLYFVSGRNRITFLLCQTPQTINTKSNTNANFQYLVKWLNSYCS